VILSHILINTQQHAVSVFGTLGVLPSKSQTGAKEHTKAEESIFCPYVLIDMRFWLLFRQLASEYNIHPNSGKVHPIFAQ